jgi:hypothetical protein
MTPMGHKGANHTDKSVYEGTAINRRESQQEDSSPDSSCTGYDYVQSGYISARA